MGNEKQINTELMEQSKSAFLPQEFQDPDAINAIYSLEEEYAKTRKNRNWILYLFVGIFLLLVIAGAVLYTTVLQTEGKKVTVDISDFNDVRLLELSNESTKIENEIEKLSYELKETKRDYKKDLGRINDQYRSQKDALQAMELPDDQKREKIATLDAQHNSQIKSVKDQYQSKTENIQSKITAYEDKLADMKTQIDEKGKLARAALGSKEELHDLQYKQLREYYENKMEKLNQDHQREINSLIYKFNPSFSDPYLKSLIRRRIAYYELPDTLLHDVEELLRAEDAVTPEKIRKIRQDTADHYRLLERLQQIPYQNSIPRALLHTESLSRNTVQSYDQIVLQLAEVIRQKNRKIAQYDHALSAKLRIDGENGFVLDTRNPRHIPVYIDPAYRPDEGARVYIFRNSEEITTATLYREDNLYYIVPRDQEAASNIRPLDNIMLQVTRE